MLKTLLFLSIAAISCQAGILPVLPGSHVPIDIAKPQAPLRTANYSKPWFCHDNDCPKFTVVETNSKFELRRYGPSVWVATTLTRMLYTDDDNRMMFFKLFGYISGNNSAGMKIAMTTPVVTRIEHGQGPDCESNFTMYFMVPLSMYANPPTPLDKTVFIARVDESMALVKSYGGFSTDDIKRQQLEEFIQDLDAAGKKYADNVFFTAGYDGPYTFNNRHNELWVSPL